MLLFAFAALYLAGTSNVEELHRAARAGDLKQVEALIAKGTPVNGRDSLGGTPLHDAAWAGEAEIVECLIRAGADVNARHSEGTIDTARLRGADEPFRGCRGAARARRRSQSAGADSSASGGAAR